TVASVIEQLAASVPQPPSKDELPAGDPPNSAPPREEPPSEPAPKPQESTPASATPSAPPVTSNGSTSPAAVANSTSPASTAVATTNPAQPAKQSARTVGASDQLIPLRGAAARIAENMTASLAIPVATSQRQVPV